MTVATRARSQSWRAGVGPGAGAGSRPGFNYAEHAGLRGTGG